MKQTINFKQFEEYLKSQEVLELKSGLITEVVEVPKSNKLLLLTVDFGEGDVRPVVTNIKKDLIDFNILLNKVTLFITNLEPASIMGIESRAMIFANQSEDKKLFFSLPL